MVFSVTDVNTSVQKPCTLWFSRSQTRMFPFRNLAPYGFPGHKQGCFRSETLHSMVFTVSNKDVSVQKHCTLWFSRSQTRMFPFRNLALYGFPGLKQGCFRSA